MKRIANFSNPTAYQPQKQTKQISFGMETESALKIVEEGRKHFLGYASPARQFLQMERSLKQGQVLNLMAHQIGELTKQLAIHDLNVGHTGTYQTFWNKSLGVLADLVTNKDPLSVHLLQVKLRKHIDAKTAAERLASMFVGQMPKEHFIGIEGQPEVEPFFNRKA